MGNYYIDIIQVGGAILIAIILGYAMAKFQWYSFTDFKILNTFTSKISLPFLMFNALCKTSIRKINFQPLLVVFLMNISSHIVLLLIFLFPLKSKLRKYVTSTISSCYVNYIIIGLPIFTAIWGEEAATTIVICPFVHYFMVVPLFVVLSKLVHILEDSNDASNPNNALQNNHNENQNSDLQVSSNVTNTNNTNDANNDNYANTNNANANTISTINNNEMENEKKKLTWKDVRDAFISSLKTPILIGAFIGLIWSCIGWTAPLFFLQLSSMYGRLVTTFALFSIGSFIYKNSLFACSIPQLLLSIFIRFIFAPLISIVWSIVLKLPPTVARQCSILGTFPLSTVAYALSVDQDIGTEATSSVVFFTSILVVPMIMWWFYFIDICGLFKEN